MKKSIILKIILAILALIIICGAVFFYLNKNKKSEKTEKNEKQNTEKTEQSSEKKTEEKEKEEPKETVREMTKKELSALSKAIRKTDEISERQSEDIDHRVFYPQLYEKKAKQKMELDDDLKIRYLEYMDNKEFSKIKYIEKTIESDLPPFKCYEASGIEKLSAKYFVKPIDKKSKIYDKKLNRYKLCPLGGQGVSYGQIYKSGKVKINKEGKEYKVFVKLLEPIQGKDRKPEYTSKKGDKLSYASYADFYLTVKKANDSEKYKIGEIEVIKKYTKY